MGDNAHHFAIGPIFSGLTAMSGAYVYHYAAGTTTDKTAWSDYLKSTTLSQPYTANAYGMMRFYGDGLYRMLVKDSSDVTIFDWDNIQVGPVQPVEISVHKNGTDQVSLPAATWTKLTWSTESYDAAGTFTSDKWTPGRTGRAFAAGQAQINSGASAASMAIAVYVNSALKHMNAIIAGSTVSGAYIVPLAAMVDVVSITDYIEIYVNPGSGESDVEGDSDKTWFQGTLIA